MYKSETDTQELKVTFLDDFKITYKDKELSQKSINSDKVTRLLAEGTDTEKSEVKAQ